MILLLFFSKQNRKVFLCLLKQKYSINYYFYIHFNKKEETYRTILLNPIKKKKITRQNSPVLMNSIESSPKKRSFQGRKKRKFPKKLPLPHFQ